MTIGGQIYFTIYSSNETEWKSHLPAKPFVKSAGPAWSSPSPEDLAKQQNGVPGETPAPLPQ
jgi:hypothetical protein